MNGVFAHRPAIGIWQFMPFPMMARYLARMGWDLIVLDLQHGPGTFESAYECVQTIRATGAAPFIRVSVGNPGEIQKALDMGAAGVVVPMVNSRAEAEACVRAAKYPPIGERSLGGDLSIHQGDDYPERANRETLLIVQVESRQALAEVEAMMELEGVDGAFIGPTDLALSMGMKRTDYEREPTHRAAIERILRACHASRKLACCNTYSLDDVGEKLAMGFDVLTYRSEIDLVASAGAELLARLRESAASRRLP